MPQASERGSCCLVDGRAGNLQLALPQPGYGDPIPGFSCLDSAALLVWEDLVLPEAGVPLCCRTLSPLLSEAPLVVSLQEASMNKEGRSQSHCL